MSVGRMSPREMRRMMDRMGMSMEAIQGATEVIIRKETSELVIQNPQITVMDVKGQKIFQVFGTSSFERPLGGGVEVKTQREIEISDEDAQLVAAQARVSPEVAKKALEDSGGDLAQAILRLTTR